MSAGKGDTPRPVKGETYRDNWTAIFGKPALPSRRYTCGNCGKKYRRGNKPEQRLQPAICPACTFPWE